MLDIKQEIQIALIRKGLSMRKIAKILRDKGFNIPKESGLSTQINNNRVRFQTVQEILDYLGFELIIKEKQ